MGLRERFESEDAMCRTEDAFETFWRAYPRRIGKGAARTEFTKAIVKTSLQAMLAALDAYVAHKPSWQDFAHPKTWLHQERWDDEWSPAPARNSMDAAQNLIARINEQDREDSSHQGDYRDVQLLPSAARH